MIPPLPLKLFDCGGRGDRRDARQLSLLWVGFLIEGSRLALKATSNNIAAGEQGVCGGRSGWWGPAYYGGVAGLLSRPIKTVLL